MLVAPVVKNIFKSLKDTFFIIIYLVEHDWLYAVTQDLRKLSRNHWLATTLENTKILVIKT